MKINNFIYNINDRVVYRIDSPSILIVQIALIDLKFIEIIHFFKQFFTCSASSVPKKMT